MKFYFSCCTIIIKAFWRLNKQFKDEVSHDEVCSFPTPFAQYGVECSPALLHVHKRNSSVEGIKITFFSFYHILKTFPMKQYFFKSQNSEYLFLWLSLSDVAKNKTKTTLLLPPNKQNKQKNPQHTKMQ